MTTKISRGPAATALAAILVLCLASGLPAQVGFVTEEEFFGEGPAKATPAPTPSPKASNPAKTPAPAASASAKSVPAAPAPLASAPAAAASPATSSPAQPAPVRPAITRNSLESFFDDWPGWDMAAMDTGGKASYLTELEKDILLELNLVRTNPQAYLAIVEAYAGFYNGPILQFPGEVGIQTSEGIPAVRELANFLRRAPAVAPLSPSPGLTKAARDHVRDQGPQGTTGHSGSDGSDMAKRISRYGRWGKSAGENIDYGNDRARLIVLSLLVDDGVASRGHRDNIMSAGYRFIGVATGAHQVYGQMCVMDFAGNYKDN